MTTERVDPPELHLDSWISALGRMSPSHPDVARILHVVDRLQDRPNRSHAIIYGEPGTGKDGLGQLLHRLMHPEAGPCVRVQLLGRSPVEIETELFGTGPGSGFGFNPGGAFARARGGSLLIDELLTLPPSCQRRLQELLSAQKWLYQPQGQPQGQLQGQPAEKSPSQPPTFGQPKGRSAEESARIEDVAGWSEPVEPSRAQPSGQSGEWAAGERYVPSRRQLLSRRLAMESQERPAVVVIALSDGDLDTAVAQGALRHDLAYKLGRIVLKVPPLRERPDDLNQAALWTANRLLRSRGILRVAELCELPGSPASAPGPGASDEQAAAQSAAASDSYPGLAVPSYCVTAEALAALHLDKAGWPGNFRELEAVLERAILLYSDGESLRGSDVERALADRWSRRTPSPR